MMILFGVLGLVALSAVIYGLVYSLIDNFCG